MNSAPVHFSASISVAFPSSMMARQSAQENITQGKQDPEREKHQQRDHHLRHSSCLIGRISTIFSKLAGRRQRE